MIETALIGKQYQRLQLRQLLLGGRSANQTEY